jgi:hypothetical protein
MLIDARNVPKQISFVGYLLNASLYIYRNNLESFKFRIRLNKYDSLTGKPGEDLIDNSIIEESSMKSGWLDFDLSKLNFKVTGPFFVTFEQLLDLKDRTAIAKGFRQYLRTYPEWFKADTVMYQGRIQISQKIERGGIDLPGTFIGVSTSASDLDNYSCFVRETSLSRWNKIRTTLAVNVTINGVLIDKPEK